MSEDLFSTNESTSDGTTSSPLFEGERIPVVDPNRNWLEEYVGEGKKFKDAAALARAKAESDAFIARLQRETEGLRQDLSTRIKLEEFMDRMNSQNSSGANQATQTAGTGNLEDGTASNATSPDDIEKLIEQRLAAREAEAARKRNLEATKTRLQEALGQDFAQELSNRTEALGLSKEFVSNLAETQPKALFALLGLDGQQTQRKEDGLFSAPRSSVNTSGLGTSGNQEKNWAYFEKIRKQNPAAYWSTQTQKEIHSQAAKLGERFYS